MADLTADADIRIKGTAHTEKWYLNTTTAVRKAYKGQPMIIDQSVDTLNAEPYVDATVVAATDVCLGIAAESKTVVLNDPETTFIEIYVAPTIVGFKSSVFTTADLGKPVYMSDSATLSGTVGDNPYIGKVFKVEDGYVYVALNTPVVCSGA
jgi:hypothetical protein